MGSRILPTECVHGVVIDWGDFGPEDGDLPTCDQCETRWANTASNLTRTRALQAAACWLSGVDPYPAGRDFVLETAGRFVDWIENGEQQ